MINFYRRFIPLAAKIMSPLFSALSGKAKGLKTLVWTDDRLKAFHEAKVALAEAALLTHPHRGAPTVLTTDASDEAVGAFLLVLAGKCAYANPHLQSLGPRSSPSAIPPQGQICLHET